MKKLELKPTDENVVEMMVKDMIDRNRDVRNFIEMLDFIDESTSISINGNWGTGKTFFVKQVIHILTYKNEFISDRNSAYHEEIKMILESEPNNLKDINLVNNFVPIYYNAWDNDSHTDPIISLVYRIVKENDLGGQEKITKGNLEKIGALLDVINPWSSGSISNMIEKFKDEDVTMPVQSIENAKEILKNIFGEVLAEKGDKVIFFIDELDRCNPIYAVNLLERIKHFFDDDRVIFVFSTNINQLMNTISNYYGTNFDSFKYLSKFFDITFELNKVNNNEYLESLGIPHSNFYFDKVVKKMATYYDFSMRECNRYIQSINIIREYVLIKRDGFSDTKGYQVMLMFFVPILLALKLVDIQKLVKILNGKGYYDFEEIILDNIEVFSSIDYTMKKNANGTVTPEEYKNQLLEIYNVIFNNNGTEEYKSDEMSFDINSKKELLEIISLLKKGLKYD